MDTQSFTESIEEFVKDAAPTSDERRSSRRFAYDVTQEVVPYNGRRLPTDDMFCRVQCRDLSTGGVSFVWPRVPDFDQVVIKLTADHRTMYVVARVVSHRPLDKSNRRSLVGCEFVDRVKILK